MITLQSMAHTNHLPAYPKAEFSSVMALAKKLFLSLFVLAFSVLKRLPKGGSIWNYAG